MIVMLEKKVMLLNMFSHVEQLSDRIAWVLQFPTYCHRATTGQKFSVLKVFNMNLI